MNTYNYNDGANFKFNNRLKDANGIMSLGRKVSRVSGGQEGRIKSDCEKSPQLRRACFQRSSSSMIIKVFN